MKLLHDFFRLHFAGLRAPIVRGAAVPEFRVTVPAPLVPAAGVASVCTSHEAGVAVRREPASFLKSSRHRRRGTSR